jgi:uncharacterized protein (DUF362 family)
MEAVLVGEMGTKVKMAKSIVIKPEAAHREYSLATTRPETLRGVIDAVRKLTGAPILVADASEYGAKEVFAAHEYFELRPFYTDVTFIDWTETPWKEVDLVVAGTPWRVRRPVITADVCISLGVLKTHHTYAAKLSVASWAESTWIPPKRRTALGERMVREPWFEAAGPENAHHMLAALYAAEPCHVSLVDGILGMEGEGPLRGTVVPMGVMIAGSDPLLTDAVALALMGRDAATVPYLVELARTGLGSINLRDANLPTSLFVERTKDFTFPV